MVGDRFWPGGDGPEIFNGNTGKKDVTLYAIWKKDDTVLDVTLNETSDQWIPLNNNGSPGTLSLIATVSQDYETNEAVQWTSTNTDVATVDNNGNVTAIRAGHTRIIVSIDGKRQDSVSVFVYNAVLKSNCEVLVYDEGKTFAAGEISAPSGNAYIILTWSGRLNQASRYYLKGAYNASLNNELTIDGRKYFSGGMMSQWSDEVNFLVFGDWVYWSTYSKPGGPEQYGF